MTVNTPEQTRANLDRLDVCAEKMTSDQYHTFLNHLLGALASYVPSETFLLECDAAAATALSSRREDVEDALLGPWEWQEDE